MTKTNKKTVVETQPKNESKVSDSSAGKTERYSAVQALLQILEWKSKTMMKIQLNKNFHLLESKVYKLNGKYVGFVSYYDITRTVHTTYEVVEFSDAEG